LHDNGLEIQARIEENNYLIFTIADRKPSEIKEVMKWSVEAFYQFLYANSQAVRRLEAKQKSDKNRSEAMNAKKRK